MNNYINKILKLAMAIALFHFSGLAIAGEVNTGYFGNVAIKGYDPVAYFTEQRAIKGNEDISHKWLGAEWNFSSEKHKKLFSENPVKFAPQYGGFCADGIAYGDFTTNIDPQAWRIIEGKLYLNYDHGSAAELEEVEGQLAKIEKNWPEVQANKLAKSE
jgi:YHS domain-containing protein